MKNYKFYQSKLKARGKLTFGIYLFIAIALPLGLLLSNCQEVTEPNDPNPSTLTVIAHDQSGNGTPNARIYLAPGETDTLLYQGTTDTNGVFQKLMSIPCEGAMYSIRVAPPLNNPDYSGEGCSDTLTLTCCDYTYSCNNIISSFSAVYCSKETKEFEIDINMCLDTTNTGSGQSSLIGNNTGCEWNMDISSANPAVPDGVELSIITSSSNNPLNLPNNFQLPDGENMSISCKVNTDEVIRYNGTVGITGICEENGDTCIVGLVRFNIAAIYCDQCACPPDSVLNLNYIDTVCVSEGHEFIIPLDGNYNFTNMTSECDYIFTLVKDFDSSRVKLTQFNGGDPSGITLKPSESFESITIEFTPGDTIAYIDTAIYTMQLKNTFGKIEDCNVSFVVSTNLIAKGADCYISPLDIEDMTQCVDIEDPAKDKQFKIENRGECEIGPVNTRLTGDDAELFNVEPNNVIIPPGGEEEFTITFHPKRDDVWPNGMGTPAKEDFYGTISLRYNSAGCDLTEYELHGIADTASCGNGYICMREYGRNNNNEGVIINERFNFTVSQNTNTAVFDIYASSIDVGAGTAVLESGKLGQFKIVESDYDFDGQNLCLETNEDIWDACESIVPGSLAQTVQPKDLLLMKYPDGSCALIWIDTIFATSTSPEDYVICLYICTKI